MFTTIRDLIKFSPSFRFGSLILLIVAVMIVLSFFSPYDPGKLRRKVKRNQPPSAAFVFGTTSQGEDVFWSTTFAVRNTLSISIIAVAIGRGIGVMLGMLSGYFGGIFDRIAQSTVESFIVIPRLPLIILIASILRGSMTMYSLGILIGLFDWAHPSKRYRSQVLSLRERDFTHTAVFSGMSTVRIVIREHLPFIIPYMLADVISGFLFSIGFEVTLSYLGLADLDSPTVGTMIYWATYYQSVFAGRAWVIIVPIVTVVLMVLGFYLMSVGLGEYLDPRKRLVRLSADAGEEAPVDDPRKEEDEIWAP
ncbi:MAG: ABC transporter permease [Chloroflexota bacterium]|nr:ABC transporter permease [Chloroflexota bacterium]